MSHPKKNPPPCNQTKTYWCRLEEEDRKAIPELLKWDLPELKLIPSKNNNPETYVEWSFQLVLAANQVQLTMYTTDKLVLQGRASKLFYDIDDLLLSLPDIFPKT